MNVNSGNGFDLEHLLEQEVQQAAGKLQGPSPLAAQSAYHAAFAVGGIAVSPMASLTAFLSTKAAIAAAAATLVVGGAAAGTVATGSPNPSNWGQAVVAAVQGCKTAEAAHDATSTASAIETTGSHASAARQNVGQCVSAFAKQHGAAQRALHHASAARENEADKADHKADGKDHEKVKTPESPDTDAHGAKDDGSSEHGGGKPADPGKPAGKPTH